MKYPVRVLLSIDQTLNTILGGNPDETFSARAHRKGWKRTEKFINWLFQDPDHCAAAYVSEMRGTQNAPDYRKEYQ